MHRGTLIREMVGPTKTLAKEVLRIRKSEIAQDRFKITKKRRAPRFEEACDRYLEHAKKSKRSWKRDEVTLKIAKAFFKKKRIDEITSWDIERFKAVRVKKVTKSTVNRDIAVLKRLFNLAIDWNLIERNPAKKVALYRIDERPMRVLSQDEERRLIEAAAPHFRPLIIVAINTGMRRGELLNLRWEQVDLHNLTITISHSKNGRVRHLPINKSAQEVLNELPEPHEGHVFRYRGLPIKAVKTAFLAAVRRAGIPRCRFHDLRHTFATRLVLAGVDLATVKELMGHADISTTMKYAHPSPPHKRDAVAKLAPPQQPSPEEHSLYRL
jgi:integrase